MKTQAIGLIGASLLAIAAPAQGAGQWEDWAAALRETAIAKERNIVVALKASNTFCPFQGTESLKLRCQSAFDVVVTRLTVERMELELLANSVELDPKTRGKLIAAIPTILLKGEGAATVVMFEELKATFALSKQSALE